MTDQDLQGLYRDINARFFSNNLPPLRVRFGRLPDRHLGSTRFQKTVPREIIINRKLRAKMLNTTSTLTLIHEMAHVKLGQEPLCGTRYIRFNAEMLRLAEMGALAPCW